MRTILRRGRVKRIRCSAEIAVLNFVSLTLILSLSLSVCPEEGLDAHKAPGGGGDRPISVDV
jgi:hypothetical protein